MKTTELKAYPREAVGKRANKAVRKEEKVPGVIYGGQENIPIQVAYKDLKPAIYTSDTYIVNLDLEGTRRDAIIREVQFHPVTEKILHIDFLLVSDDKPVTLALPVKLIGKAVGVGQGGKLVPKLRRIKVKGVPSQLPEFIEVDVSDLELGNTIKVADAEIEGLEIVSSPSAAVASVEIPRALRSSGLEDEEGVEEGEEGTEEAAEESED